MTENQKTPPTPEQPYREANDDTSRALLQKTRRAYSRCGWAILALTLLLTLFSAILTILLQSSFAKRNGLIAPIREHILYLNEVIVLVAILLAMLVFWRMPKSAPKRQALSPGLFFVLFTIAVAMGLVGNLRSTAVNAVWESITAIPQQNELTVTLDTLDPLQMTVCVGILAPLIEELFFRKLLIDRLYAHGPLTAILLSAVAFSLFHGNFDQLYYTFGIGLLLGYLYCHTGSYLAVVFLHMALNVFSGVIPVLLLSDLPLDTLMSEAALLSESLTASLSTLLYLIYAHISFSIDAIGVTFFFLFLKRIKVPPRETPLTRTDHTSAVLLNGGVITAGVIYLIQLFLSLFTG